MARPPNLNTWGTGWNHAALVPAYGAMYAQQAQQYRHPYITVTQPTTAPSMSAALSAAVVAPLKRARTEVEEATSGANSKDHHVLWMRAYDKPMPEFLKNKCKPLYCELCSVNLNSIIQAKMHYEGKGHEKKIRFALQTWAKENDTVPPKKASTSTQQTVDAVVTVSDLYGPSPAQRPRFDYPYTSHARDLYCEPCDTSFTSHAHAQQHLSGRNHKRVVSGLAPLKAGYFNTRTGKWQRQPPQDGDEAGSNKVVEADQVFNHHPVPPGLPPPPPPPPPLPGPEADEAVQAPIAITSVEGPKYCCNVCGVVATSQAQLDMHLSGRNHKARCAKLGIQTYDQPVIPSTGPMPKTENETKSKPKKDYSIYRTPSGQYYCALCNMCVNSEQTFVQHIASRKHKLKESSAKGKKSKSKK